MLFRRGLVPDIPDTLLPSRFLVKLRVKGFNRGVEALRHTLSVNIQRNLCGGVPHLRLLVFDRYDSVKMGGESPTQCLKCQSRDAGPVGGWPEHVAFEVVARMQWSFGA